MYLLRIEETKLFSSEILKTDSMTYDISYVPKPKNLTYKNFFINQVENFLMKLKDVNFFTTPVAQKILSRCSILLEISALQLRKCIKYKYT